MATAAAASAPSSSGIQAYYSSKIDELEVVVREKTHNLRRLEAQRNELNSKVRLLREELSLLQEPGSYVGEVVKVMGRKKVLVKARAPSPARRPTRHAAPRRRVLCRCTLRASTWWT